MAEQLPQTYANHARTHPLFHFFLLPGAAIFTVLTAVNVVRHPQRLDAWALMLLGLLLPFAVLLIRIYALQVQNRVIRLEERLRLHALLSADLCERVPELTPAQLIALRFASDQEVAGLAAKALESGMKPVDIKKSIATWRPDTFRV
jgi:hypothetical protein